MANGKFTPPGRRDLPKPHPEVLRLGCQLKVSDAEDGALGFVGEAFDLPAVGENNLLNNCQPQTGALFLSRKIRLEDLAAAVWGDAWAVVADLEHSFRGIALLGNHLNLAVAIYCLDGVQDEVKEGLPEQLFIGLDAQHIALDLERNLLLVQIVVQGADHLRDDRAEGEDGAADLAWARVVDRKS